MSTLIVPSIFRHEGRKLKQELRCHAVLCPSASKARFMAERLKERLHQALIDFKKEKVWRQNARLSLANSTSENPTMPYRKVLCSVSGNYRPPIERGKAAPKLKIIEEVITEEDESIHEDVNDELEGVSNAAGVKSDINERRIDWPIDEPASSVSYAGHNTATDYNSRHKDEHLRFANLIDEDSNVNYKRLSVCSDNISVVTTETTVILEPEMSVDSRATSATPQKFPISDEGQLIDISNDPLPMPRPAPRHSLGKVSSSSNGPSSSSIQLNSTCGINIENGCEPGTGNCGSSDEEDEEDVVTNYLDKMSIIQENRLLVDSPQLRADSYSSRSPDSHQFSTKSDSSVVGDNDEIEDEEGACDNDENGNGVHIISKSIHGVQHNVLVDTKMSSSKADQDTISDESGYSEESNAVSTINGPHSSSTSPEVSVRVVNKRIAKESINGAKHKDTHSTLLTSDILNVEENTIEQNDRALHHDTECKESKTQKDCSSDIDITNSDMQVQEDPTVHGVFISDFSTSDRLKYLERSRQISPDTKLSPATTHPDFFQNKIQEFVINI